MSLSEKLKYKLFFAPHVDETQDRSCSHGVNTSLCFQSLFLSLPTVTYISIKCCHERVDI